jgi:hypothetical protein
MDTGTFLRLLTSWQFLVVCLFVILLLPLVVYIASRSSGRGPRLRSLVGRGKAARPPRSRPPAAEEAKEEE